MPPKDLGTKHTCFKCGTKFYDLKKPEPICPKCGADQRQSPAKSPPPAERRPRRAPEPKTEEVEVELEEDAELEDDEAEDAADDDEP